LVIEGLLREKNKCRSRGKGARIILARGYSKPAQALRQPGGEKKRRRRSHHLRHRGKERIMTRPLRASKMGLPPSTGRGRKGKPTDPAEREQKISDEIFREFRQSAL